MINQKRLGQALLFIVSIGIFNYFYQNNTSDEQSKVLQTKDILHERYLKKKAQKNAKDYVKADKPDQFIQLMNSLKVRKDDNEHQYTKGYKLKETLKAKAYFKSNNRVSQTITDEQWVERGPNNVPGRTRTLVVDKNDPTNNTWIAGSVAGGIWKTTNKGSSWTPLTDDLPTLSISHISQSESNPNIWYACTGEGYGNIDGVKGDGIFKSTDGGNSWFSLENTLNNDDFQIVNRLIIDPNNADNLTVCTSANPGRNYRSSIFISRNGGETWDKMYEEEYGGYYTAILQVVASPDDFNVQYATIKNKGILKSEDMGVTWKALEGYNPTGRIELAISEVNPNYIFASISGAGEGSSDGNLYLSKDAGDTWDLLKSEEEIRFLGGQGWYDNAVMAHPFDENSFYVAGVDIWRINLINDQDSIQAQRVSNAYGENDELLNPSLFMTGSTFLEGFHPDHHSLVPVKTSVDEFYIINTSDGGVFYSNTDTNPGEKHGDWTFAGFGYNTTQLYSVDKKTGANQYVGGSQDNGTWISFSDPRKTSNYKMFLGGDGFDAVWHSEDHNKMLATVYNNLIYRSDDGGRTLSRSYNGITDLNEKAPFITKLANSKQNPETVFTVGATGVWRSQNFGESWELRRISEENWKMSSFVDIKISEANTDVIWAGNQFTGYSIQLSKDNGQTFDPVAGNTGDLNMTGYISGITADPIYEENAYILFSYANYPKIIKTTDFGENWVDISGFEINGTSSNGFPNVGVYDLLVFPFNDDFLWAGTEIGIFESLDGGDSWHPLDGSLPNVCVWDMKYSDNQVYIGTHGRGIWSVDIPENPQPKVISYNSTLAGVEINVNIDTEADSIIVFNKSKERIKGFNTSFEAGNHILFVENTNLSEKEVQFISYKNNLPYKSRFTTLEVIEFNTASNEYFNDFTNFNTSADFVSDGILFNSSVTGFSFAGLHSRHPYEVNTESYSYLKTPIIVKEDNSNFFYKDVTLVSEDDDFVTIEAKKGNDEWVNISGSYDASFNENWKHYADLGSNGAESLEVRHQIDLQDFFNAGDTIAIRFKLTSGETSPNWGWAVTYLNIQSKIEEPVVTSSVNQALFNSMKVYPTVISNNETNIEFNSTISENLSYQLIDINGRVLQSSTFKVTSGNNKVPIQLNKAKEGIYILVVSDGKMKQSFKLAIQ
ncbi:T9SS type A sorting domain-containing protein [Flammeovirga sp. SJP92]|uniref:T9SS type A sorting domain-containing protein n=1 Tax=Flammeovirga sp. SJP92 TaxID=1775430 RepID=UPI000788145F|nr:T9SS type A sorting domain-containing protein [Flammeovirga sp. SJP92]KXX68859.1 hypothetical protein AVL50_18680 [Flammeovirga sp. SJP92]